MNALIQTGLHLHDWSHVEHLRLDWHHPYLKKLHEMTDALLEVGKGNS